tara:strand:+ start:1544 stop:3307 length:1764 start_codon:yes stop_codon:yes gene_type:complete
MEYFSFLFEEESKPEISSIVDDTNINIFKLPITYLENKKRLSDNIYTDLELIESADSSNCLYDYVFDGDNVLGKQMRNMWSEYYTTNEDFLKDSQKFYSEINITETNDSITSKKILDAYLRFVNNSQFKSEFDYIEWKYLEFCNHNTFFLQTLCIYNMSAPILSLIMPIIMLIIPFLILKLQGIEINIKEYTEILQKLINNALIGQMFKLHTMAPDKAFYTICSFGFYIFQIYQNINHCYRFNKNLIVINETLIGIREYNKITIKNMEMVLIHTEHLKTYSNFHKTVALKLEYLKELNEDLEYVEAYKFNIRKIIDIGYVMKYFYKVFQQKEYIELIIYSLGFNGYISNILDIKSNIKLSFMNKAKFKKNKLKFKGAFYAPLKDTNKVKNDYNLKDNMLITGPNAAGKTTLLKTTLFNLILVQQVGYGFFKEAIIEPYTHFHCYLNIPDTSGRDSLFQAEARRCKDILQHIQQYNKKDRHFCIFDELYSGTNPYEAVASAYAYLLYIINNHKNFRFMITTHYLELCDKLKSKINNSHMEVLKNEDNFRYTYLVKKGTSSVKGGLKVLSDLEYPIDIINKANDYLNKK